MLRGLAKRLRRLRRRLVRHEIVVIGDSHARVFRHWWFDVMFPSSRFRLCIVGGATASGLQNPNSKTQAYAHFREAVRSASGKHVVCLLGEVDTGFVIWLRAERHGARVEDMLHQAIDTYCTFLAEAAGVARSITVVSAPLPSIGDGAPRGEVAENRRDVRASQRQRTDLTLQFNRALAERCRKLGFGFVDLDGASLGAEGLVKRSLLNSDPADHHFAFEPYARLLAWRLHQALDPNRV